MKNSRHILYYCFWFRSLFLVQTRVVRPDFVERFKQRGYLYDKAYFLLCIVATYDAYCYMFGDVSVPILRSLVRGDHGSFARAWARSDIKLEGDNSRDKSDICTICGTNLTTNLFFGKSGKKIPIWYEEIYKSQEIKYTKIKMVDRPWNPIIQFQRGWLQ